MIRTQLYLTAEELAALDRVASETGRTRSLLVREAIEARYMQKPSRDELASALRASAGAWKTTRRDDRDGTKWVARLRNGSLAKRLRRAGRA